MLFNIKTIIYSEQQDIEDVRRQLSFLSELIKIELTKDQENPIWSISLTTQGFVIQFGKIANYEKAKLKINEVFARYDWLDAIVNMKVLLHTA